MKKTIGIIGVGGVGGYFGGKLCHFAANQDNLDVCFVARGKHLACIRESGLLLSTADEGDIICRPTMATDNCNALPQLDYCLLCVKEYDLRNVLRQLQSKISPNTLIVPLLNGIDIYERVREMVDQGIVFPACVYVGTHIERPGKVTQMGGACKILLGRDPHHPEVNAGPLLELFDQGQIKYEWLDDPYPEIWKKYVFIAAFGLVTARYDKCLGQIMESEELRRQTQDIMKEIVSLAKAKGVELPPEVVGESLAKADNFPYETKTSFQRDYELANKPDERDLFGGTILRLGTALGISTPTTEHLHRAL